MSSHYFFAFMFKTVCCRFKPFFAAYATLSAKLCRLKVDKKTEYAKIKELNNFYVHYSVTYNDHFFL